MLELARWIYLAILVWQGLWWGWLNPPSAIPVSLALTLAGAPLLIFLPAVWKRSPRGLVLAGCILLAYFAIGVMEWWAGTTTRTGGAIQTGLTLAYFGAVTVGLRRLR